MRLTSKRERASTERQEIIGGNIPQKERSKLNIEDKMEYIFDRLIFAKPVIFKDRRADCQFLPQDMGPMWAHISGEKNEQLFCHPEDVNHPELVWPVSIGMIHDLHNEEWGRHIRCNFWQSSPASKLRGHFRGIGKHNISTYSGYLHDGGKWAAIREVGSWHFNKWRSAPFIRRDQAFSDAMGYITTGPIERLPSVGDRDIGSNVAMGQSIALTYRYEWGAQFSIDGSVRVIVPTTPRGILELFNDRNKPADKDRRAALRHWVSQHLRRKPTKGFAAVRSHLRGEVSFKWRGFDVTIVPSQFDQENNLGLVA